MESGRIERPQSPIPARPKAGLETPLEGRFAKENRRLAFAPPVWYDALVAMCLAGGLLIVFLSFAGLLFGNAPAYGEALGALIAFAGVWAALSNERINFNLTYRTYARLEGQGLRKRMIRGSLDEIDALVLVTEELTMPIRGSRSVMYRLVLHWKGQRHPLLIVEREAHSLPPGAPLNALAGELFHKGQRYAQALGVRFFDNSQFHSPCPVPVA